MTIPKTTAYMIMRQCDEGTPMSRKSGSGRPATKMPPWKCRRLQTDVKEKIGASQSRAAMKYGISQQYVSKILRGKTTLRYRKRQPAPDVTEGQKRRQKTACTIEHIVIYKMSIFDLEIWYFFALVCSKHNAKRNFQKIENFTDWVLLFLKPFQCIFGVEVSRWISIGVIVYYWGTWYAHLLTTLNGSNGCTEWIYDYD